MKDTRKIKIILCAVLLVLTYGSFNITLDNDFITYDDTAYITKNQNVLQGLTPNSLKWAFQTTHTGNWIPLTWLSHMLDVELFGVNPGKHHMTNLIIHCLNALLVFLLFHKMTDCLWASFLTALLFAIHPLRAESVAWASERKDVLSMFFGLLSLWSYVVFAGNKRFSAYCLTGIFLALGLMSKSMLVTWPFVFLLLDFWPLKRFPGNRDNTLNDSCFSQKTMKQLWVEKLPFFGIVLIFCVIAYWAQRSAGAVPKSDNYPLCYRIENALNSYIAYIKLTFFPHGLGILYPLISRHITLTNFIVCLCLLSGLTFLFFRLRKQKPYLLVGWLWFLGTLVPVLGLVQIGSQAMADRYTYIPGIGLTIMAVFFVSDLARRGRFFRIIITAGAALAVFILIVLTQIQCSYWKDSFTLYRHTLEVTKNNYTMLMNYGYVLANAKEFDAAKIQFQQAHQLVPRPGRTS